jgi:hypothetical protein
MFIPLLYPVLSGLIAEKQADPGSIPPGDRALDLGRTGLGIAAEVNAAAVPRLEPHGKLLAALDQYAGHRYVHQDAFRALPVVPEHAPVAALDPPSLPLTAIVGSHTAPLFENLIQTPRYHRERKLQPIVL